MKTLKKIWIICAIALFGVGYAGPAKAMAKPEATMNISFQTFYNELSPFGMWIMDPVHGYVWKPDVEPGFMPYGTRGHWAMTQYGNTWVSDYAWGWAPFHYGRWHFDAFYGWVWVPGNVWGPAWVSWRIGGGFFGWAPLGPGMSIHAGFGGPMSHWMFVSHRHFMSPFMYRHFIPDRRVVRVYNQTTIINNYHTHNNQTYVYGPRASQIERYTRNPVPVYEVNSQSQPGRPEIRNNSVSMYRPEVSTGRNEAPKQVITRENAPRSNRSVQNNARVTQEAGNAINSRNTSRSNRTAVEQTAEGVRSSQATIETARSARASREIRQSPNVATMSEGSLNPGSESRPTTTVNRNSHRARIESAPRPEAARIPDARMERSSRPAAPAVQQRTQVSRDQRQMPQPQRPQVQRQQAPRVQQQAPRVQQQQSARATMPQQAPAQGSTPRGRPMR
jgi:hypothetical protein